MVLRGFGGTRNSFRSSRSPNDVIRSDQDAELRQSQMGRMPHARVQMNYTLVLDSDGLECPWCVVVAWLVDVVTSANVSWQSSSPLHKRLAICQKLPAGESDNLLEAAVMVKLITEFNVTKHCLPSSQIGSGHFL